MGISLIFAFEGLILMAAIALLIPIRTTNNFTSEGKLLQILFDFPLDPQGQPWFLEAGLYCSFSPKSAIASMAKAAGITLPELLKMMIVNTWKKYS